MFPEDSVPAAQDGENCNKIAYDMVKENLKLHVSPNIVSVAHRIGRKQGPDHRDISVKLFRREMKKDITDACRYLKYICIIYVNESRTPQRIH